MAGKKSILDKIRAHYYDLKEAEAEAEIYHHRYLEEINAAYAQEVAAAQQEQQSAHWVALARHFQRAIVRQVPLIFLNTTDIQI